MIYSISAKFIEIKMEPSGSRTSDLTLTFDHTSRIYSFVNQLRRNDIVLFVAKFKTYGGVLKNPKLELIEFSKEKSWKVVYQERYQVSKLKYGDSIPLGLQDAPRIRWKGFWLSSDKCFV